MTNHSSHILEGYIFLETLQRMLGLHPLECLGRLTPRENNFFKPSGLC